MSTLAEIAAAAAALSAQDKAELLRILTQPVTSSTQGNSGGGRIAGLHAGNWEVAEDFDAPLGDEFWTGGPA